LEHALTDFVAELRHHCRNPRCRSKLKAPVTNPREAFCTRGCHGSFYLKRCRVCEEPIERAKRGARLICKKSKCRNAFKDKSGFGRYAASSDAELISEKPVNKGAASPVKTRRAWFIVAGPKLSPRSFHAATIPDGPEGKWEGGFYRRIEAESRATVEAHEKAKIEANGYFTDPEWNLFVSPDACEKYHGKSLVTRFRPEPPPAITGDLAGLIDCLIPADLSIPAFLRRAA
jgi:hypothetical protein